MIPEVNVYTFVRGLGMLAEDYLELTRRHPESFPKTATYEQWFKAFSEFMFEKVLKSQD
jgi:hypothetical protein